MIEEATEYDTFPKLLTRNYEKWPNAIAMRKKDFGIWQKYTWRDCYEKVKYFSLGLISLGLKREDKVAIVGENEPEWFWAQFAIQAAGAWPAGIFVDMVPSEVKFITEHSDSRFAVANDQEQVDKFLAVKDELPKLEKVIYWDPRGLKNYDDPLLLSFKQVLELGREYEKLHPGLFEENVAKQKGEDIAQVYYTSGTSGVPKAALVSHRALIASGIGFLQFNPVRPSDEFVSHFPAAWIGEGMFATTAHLLGRVRLNFAEEPETIREDLRDIGPHVVIYGPRQWESESSVIQMKMHDAGLLKKLAYHLFLPVGYKRARLYEERKKPSLLWRLLITLADIIVFHPLRDKLGLLRCKTALTGSAAMSIDTFRMWSALGLNLKQIYGSTEGGFMAGHAPDDIKFETIGPIARNCTLMISKDGEVMVKGPGLFSGYYKDPVKSSEVFDENGWLHTGDAGYVDDGGHLVFLDRVSDLVQLRSGARYAPQYIEGRLRFSPYIQDAMTVGDENKDYISVVIIINFENVGKWAEDNHINYTTFVDLSQKEQVAELIRPEIRRVNEGLPDVSKIKKYVLLHKEFDPDEAELTRTRKLRRGFMTERYSNIIDAIYGDKTGVDIEASVTYRDGRKGTVKTTLKVWLAEEERK